MPRKSKESAFTAAELRLIMEDQMGNLRSFHVGYARDCAGRLAKCPHDHFSGVTWAEIDRRQSIIRRLLLMGSPKVSV